MSISTSQFNSKRYIHPNTNCNTIYNTTTTRGWKQPSQLTDEWTEKMWSIYAVEYYSARKRMK